MARDEPRCPYCVEGDAFKLMTQKDDKFCCQRCGHLLLPSDPSFVCYCSNCEGHRSRIGDRPRTKAG